MPLFGSQSDINGTRVREREGRGEENIMALCEDQTHALHSYFFKTSRLFSPFHFVKSICIQEVCLQIKNRHPPLGYAIPTAHCEYPSFISLVLSLKCQNIDIKNRRAQREKRMSFF